MNQFVLRLLLERRKEGWEGEGHRLSNLYVPPGAISWSHLNLNYSYIKYFSVNLFKK